MALILFGGTVGAPPASGEGVLLSALTTTDGTWQNIAFDEQISLFKLTFDVTVSAASSDLVVGVGTASSSAYSTLSSILRANTSNTVDARFFDIYQADNVVPYVPVTKYSAEMYIDPDAGIYSAVFGGTTVGSAYSFRDTAPASALGWVSIFESTGSGSLIENLRLVEDPFSGHVPAVVDVIGDGIFGPSDSPSSVFYGRVDLQEGDIWAITSTSGGLAVNALGGGDFTWSGTGSFDWEIRRVGLIYDSNTYSIS